MYLTSPPEILYWKGPIITQSFPTYAILLLLLLATKDKRFLNAWSMLVSARYASVTFGGCTLLPHYSSVRRCLKLVVRCVSICKVTANLADEKTTRCVTKNEEHSITSAAVSIDFDIFCYYNIEFLYNSFHTIAVSWLYFTALTLKPR